MIQLNKKTIYIIVAVLVVVIIIAGAAYILSNSGNGGTTSPTPTPTPTVSVVDATTLQFSVNETTNGALVTYNYAAKNVNTTSEVLRLDIPGGSVGNYSYIINLSTSTSSFSTDNGATWIASDFNTDSTAYIVAFSDYQTNLVNWNGHDESYSYTAASNGASIVIYAIHVNPTLADSLFATS